MYLGGTVLRGGGVLIEGGQENHKGRVDSCGDQRMGRKAAFLSIVELGLGFEEDLVRKLHLGGSVAKQCDGRKDAKALISMKLISIKKLMSQCCRF